MTDPEGGNIIFEYIYLDSNLQAAFGLPAGVTTVNRVMAYFSDGMTPEDNPLPTPGQCNNLDATKGWPLFIGNSTDLDVGDLSITGVNTAGAATTISVPKLAAGKDAIGRMHTTYYQVVNPVAANFVKPDSAYSVSFGGAGTVPATTFDTGMYLAADFQVSDPPFEGAPPLVAGTDYTVHWTPGTSNLPAGPDYAAGHGGGVTGLTWLADMTGSPTHVCPTAHSDGKFTIPGATIAEYKTVATARGTDTTHALLLRQAVVHILDRLPNGEPKNKRRLDMLAIMCWVQVVGVN